MNARGLLTLGTHNLSYAHDANDVARALAAYEEVLPWITTAIETGNLAAELRCKPLAPLFRVRGDGDTNP